MKEAIGEIIEIKEETYDVKTFIIKFNEIMDFIPGQYCMTSLLDVKGFEGKEKPFTYTNVPGSEFVELTIKKIGEFTTVMHELDVGVKVKIKGPFGEVLNFDKNIKDDVVFLAGGSGITPFISAIRYIIEKKLNNNVTLFFGNRTKKDIIYAEEFKEHNELDNITIVNTLSDTESKKWTGHTGRIDKQLILEYVDNPENKLWYICGPPPMVAGMKILLEEIGINKDKIRVENWEMPGKHDADK